MSATEDHACAVNAVPAVVKPGARSRAPASVRARRLAETLDRFVERTGRASAWLTLLLVLLVAGDVGARYFWHVSSVAEQELEWHVLAVIAMLAASYTIQQGEHVRVDIFYNRYNERVKQWMEVLLPLLVILPVALFLAAVSVKFVWMSYAINESSPDPGGLPARWLLKGIMPVGFILVALQGVAMSISNFFALRADSEADRGH